MKELIDFSLDTENPQKNYYLAKWYEKTGHTAPAHTYYLRSAERSEDKLLTYQALLRASFCYKSQGSRDATEKVLLENAVMLLPERPEAYYFLSIMYERKEDWQNSYIYSSFGLNLTGDNLSVIDVPEYTGKHLLMYQKAVASWWWGKGQESRDLFSHLMNNCWDDLDSIHKKLVEDNISRLGITSESQSQILYTNDKYNQLRYKFKGSETIKNNYSQVFQDMFILSMLDGKRHGTFLEIGGAKPFDRNNTALLEEKFGWTGVSVELNNDFVNEYRNQRPNINVIHQDALNVNYEKLLQENFNSNVIDYLQLDIEPAKNTYECMLKIPFNKYKFAVITYEHDYYIDPTKSYREKSREFLKENGYVLVVNDISPEGKSTFEDWWVHPDLINKNILNIMTDVSGDIKKVDNYMFPLKYYAEYETDKYIRETFFPDFSYEGIMVEVGAGPPSFISNSKHFRDSGWRTICVEPNPKFVNQHKKEGSEVYQYACCNEEGEKEFIINYNNDEWYTKENDGVSFSSLGIRYQGVPEHNTQEKIKVKTIKLDNLLSQTKVKKVDVLSIDVEGWELDVMRGFSPNKFNTKVIIIENIGNKKEYQEYMLSQNFSLHTTLGCNEIYILNEQKMETTKDLSKETILKIYDLYDRRYGPIWGFCSNDKAGCLIDYVDDLCNRVDNPVCVEIGVYGGKSILPVALELQRHNKGVIHAIDPWDNNEATKGYDEEHYYFWKNIDLEKYYNIFVNSLNEFGLNNYVNILRTTSDNAPDFDKIDLLYIDGQHTEQALKDAKKYSTKIPPGGYCLVDDVNWGEVRDVPKYLLENGFELINGVDVCKIFKKKDIIRVNININDKTKAKNTVWSVDNFYEDPDSVRNFALNVDYFDGGIGRGFIGKRSSQQYLFSGLKERFEEIIGRKITAWEEHDMNGRFQVSWSGEPLVYHCDSQKWGGMLYLTPDAPYQCGTTLYAHKKTRARSYYDKGWDAAWVDVPGDCHLDGTPFEPVDVLGNVYNRLVIFDASCIHAASEYFGTVMENARLWQMFFFDSE